MIFKPDEIEFNSAAEFLKFASMNDLFGSIQLKEPILDSSGNVLIKERVNLSESLIRKIGSMEGKHVSILRVNITKGLTEKLKLRVANEATNRITESGNKILAHLFENNQAGTNSYKSVVENAFVNPKIIIFLFRLMTEKKEFFYHCIDNGLFTLAAVIQKSFQIRFVHRYAFLSGIFCDLSLMDTNLWKDAISNGDDLTVIAKSSSSLLTRYNFPAAIVNSIHRVNLQSLHVEMGSNNRVNLNEIKGGNISIEINTSYQDAGTLDDEVPPDEDTDRLIEIIAEALKISKFISMVQKQLQSKSENIAQQLITSLAYNAEKGIFNKELANPMIDLFKELQEIVLKVRKVASVENMCLYQPSAWAYPKPEPTQILCKQKIFECKYIVSGWDISIFSEKEAFGYIGTKLMPGQYPKCRLEEHLDISEKVSKKKPS
jgi:hypothetical protein